VLAIALSLGASLGWGAADFLGGLKSRSLSLLTVLLVSQVTALALLGVFMLVRWDGPPEGEFLLYAALAGVAEAVGVAALYKGLADGVMSVVAPLAATAPVVPVVAGIAIGESPAALQAVGILLVLAGIVGTSIEPAERKGSGRLGVSLVYGLLAAVGFGAFYVGLDAASEADVPWALLGARVVAVALFAAAFLARRPGTGGRAELPALMAIGVLVVSADSLYAVASTEGLLSVVAVLSSLFPVVTIALARFYLHERLGRAQQVGVAIALSGVVALSIA
jgi:drug/metabolite transporter (DMT)-like permease